MISLLVGRLLDFKIAFRFGLFGLRQGFRHHALLIGLRFRNGCGPLRLGALDGGVAFRFGRGDVGISFDACDVGTAHVRDVFVLVADFFDRE